MGGGGVDLAQDRDQWWAFMSIVMNSCSIKSWKFLEYLCKYEGGGLISLWLYKENNKLRD
jgi:hypothetical protein